MRSRFFYVITSACAIVGSVVGAGFITGAEIVTFFSSVNLLPACFLLFILLALMFWILLSAGRRFGGLNKLNLRVLGRFSPIFNVATAVFSVISACSMCAAADAVVSSVFSISDKIPVLSLPLILVSCMVCKRGVRGVGVFNLCLVPIMISVIIIACVGSGGVAVHEGSSDVHSIIIYACMNAFLVCPLIVDSGARADRKAVFPTAILSSAVISISVYLIMKKISTGYGTDENLPLLSSVSSSWVFHSVFSVICVFGIVTTLISSHYNVLAFFSKYRVKRALNVCFMLFAVAFSRIGLSRIVNGLYPLIGLFGLAYFILLSTVVFKDLFSPLADDSLYHGNERVHPRCKQAQNKRGRKHQIHSENLPAVHD